MNLLVNDLKLILRDRLSIIAIFIFCLSVFFSVFLGNLWADKHRDVINQYANTETLIVNKNDEIHPRTFERKIIMPPAPLLNLTIGRTDIDQSYTSTSFWTREDNLFNNVRIDDPIPQALGKFDLTFISIWLSPLLLIALGLSILSADRDTGMLRMEATASISFGRIALVRGGVRFLIVFIPICIAAIIGSVLSPFTSDKVIRLLYWITSVAAYLLFWQSIIIFVSSYKIRQEALAATLFSIWIILTAIIPAFGSVVVQSLNEIPTKFGIITEARTIEVELRNDIENKVKDYKRIHPHIVIGEETPKYAVSAAINNGIIENRLRPLISKNNIELEEQQRNSKYFELISPALLVNRLLADSAGSGEFDFNVFKKSGTKFHQDLRANLVYFGLRGKNLTIEDVNKIPRYSSPEVFRTRIFNITFSILYILFLTYLLLFISFNRLNRQDFVL